MLKTHLIIVVGAALALSLVGCKRRQPSEAFTQASEEFDHLYARELDNAYLDPRMAAIEAKLSSVPPDSLDARGANELLRRIRDGERRMSEKEEARRKSEAAVNAPTPDVQFQEKSGAAVAQGSAAPDAGPSAEPAAGMSFEEFTRRFSDCFHKGGPLRVEPLGVRDTYVLNDDNYCRQHHPGFDQQLVIVDTAKVIATVPQSSVSVVPPSQGAGAAGAAADGGGGA